MTAIIVSDINCTGTLQIKEDGISPQLRSAILKQTPNAIFPIQLADLRVWDAVATNLPGTAAADDLAYLTGTFGTAPPVISAGDCKNLGATTRYARVQIQLPECYDSGETITLAIASGMRTTIASTSCTVDVECYKIDKIGGIGADLCTTVAQSINSLTFASRSFTITPSGLVAGDVLDVRITIVCTDTGTATAVTPTIAAIDLVCDIKG